MTLLKHPGFFAYLCIAFLNAFIDLGHKIIIQNTIFKLYDGQQQIMLTAIVNAFILLPFILMFSPSGFISDKFPKHQVIRCSALLAIIATSCICFAYYQGWFWGAFAMTLVLAVQSAIYSPAKYGYIKELVGTEKLAAANGLVQAMTIVSILGSTFVFSLLFENLLVGVVHKDEFSAYDIITHIAPLGFVLIALSLLEFVFSLSLSAKNNGNPDKRFQLKTYVVAGYLIENIQLVTRQRTIFLSIVGLCMFWSISQVVLASFPAYAKEVLLQTNTVVIQGILACTGVGIMLGSLFAGFFSKNHIELGFIPLGAIGIVSGLVLMAGSSSYVALVAVFLLLGFSGGLFIVPLNSLIQYHASDAQLGTVLAGNNWFQNVSMVLALSTTVAMAYYGINSQELFYLVAAFAFLGSLYTIKQLPHSLARIIVSVFIKRRYQFAIEGFEHLPANGGTLLVGNHVTWIDWLLIQIASPRPIRFVMLKEYYQLPIVKYFFKFFGAIPVSPGQSKQALKTMAASLAAGELVCIFPEGQITKNGQLSEFKAGYKRAIAMSGAEVAVIPFYLDGMWGSRWSKAEGEHAGLGQFQLFKRKICMSFGQALVCNIEPDELRDIVQSLQSRAEV